MTDTEITQEQELNQTIKDVKTNLESLENFSIQSHEEIAGKLETNRQQIFQWNMDVHTNSEIYQQLKKEGKDPALRAHEFIEDYNEFQKELDETLQDINVDITNRKDQCIQDSETISD